MGTLQSVLKNKKVSCMIGQLNDILTLVKLFRNFDTEGKHWSDLYLSQKVNIGSVYI